VVRQHDVIQPFNADMKEHGHYQYSGSERKSSVYANRRWSNVIRDSFDWAGKKVVDVGCGDGTFTARLRDETTAASILGIDPAQDAINYACSTHLPTRQGLAFRSCFVRDLLAEGEQFDIAVYRGVIHHVADPAQEIKDALALAEEVYLVEPNGLNPILKLLERFSPYHVQHKEQSFTIGKHKRWIRHAGGEVLPVRIFGLVPFFAPDWMVTLCSAMEPVIERIPVVRLFACGQTAYHARRKPVWTQGGRKWFMSPPERLGEMKHKESPSKSLEDK
jgi:SAM-dependent methyltransferase